ncbi:HlyD family secretion protein [Mesorhizobium sp. M2D.F.Ca.ET.185.01.1.1]|uniref:HlyD family secretion protein n=2 Tax=Mesorhizobium TaxID=68287 RepID=UPI000FCA6AAB|nr:MULTISPECIES: HlyD family secretion protein [unclassified Mesorhizobium]TGP81941.1 HlyD family secretion protein [bacterium M00.F.Ca.ET.227.01.1.1]TGP92167.1 HlyD family secretion protein [bacterium M00.F.Ca.ET.221.01.1.1]TGP95048.1 HlyD family secretion protein [bacterium M00.F.Ca.ET.222.01.1.1]TGU09845.1 HlyD family secretion protein [bacterium M00.F.Ca.ET.163.01.1.1]TGU39030.1 HlyD family secretion protein [bacterium M00.F.Ca.ET.156.01.1.1]TGU47632.1 HlyD family secretion protein [bacte
MSEGTSSRKPADQEGERVSDQVIRLDSQREQRRGNPPVVEDDELEAPVAPEPAKLEAPSAQPKPASVTVAPPAPAQPRRSLMRPILFALLPVALVAGGYYYVVGGQVMTTDNAYIQAQSLGVSTDVSGTVDEIDVHDNQAVKKGDVLFRLRPASFETALAGAEAQLGTVRNQVLTLQASYKQSLASIDQAEADIPYYESAFQRQQDLLKTSTASKATFDSAQHDLVAARQKVTVAKAQAQAMLAQLGGDASQPVEKNPFYLQALSAVDDAQRNLNVKAPFDGIVTNVDALQVGKYLPASQPAFSLVSSTDIWIAAEPKETELTYVRPGQKATISIDGYPGEVWHGTVGSISPASSSSFSLLPAQNTSGNWVKVVQRIPMRVTIDDQDGKPPLRGGMSAVVDIDTGHARGLPDFVTDLLKRFGQKS